MHALEQNMCVSYHACVLGCGREKQATPCFVLRAAPLSVTHRQNPSLNRSRRDLELILDAFEKGEPFYLYTGRVRSPDLGGGFQRLP